MLDNSQVMTEHSGDLLVQRDLLIDGRADKRERQMNILQKVLQGFILAVMGVLLIGLGAGCAATVSTDPLDSQVAGAPADQAPLAGHKITAIADLPVPAKMKINKSASYSYEGAGSRDVDYTYSGWVDIRRVHRFYREQMPLNRWQMLGDDYSRGVYWLTFQKNREICTVIIRKSLIFWIEVRLRIQQPEINK